MAPSFIRRPGARTAISTCAAAAARAEKWFGRPPLWRDLRQRCARSLLLGAEHRVPMMRANTECGQSLHRVSHGSALRSLGPRLAPLTGNGTNSMAGRAVHNLRRPWSALYANTSVRPSLRAAAFCIERIIPQSRFRLNVTLSVTPFADECIPVPAASISPIECDKRRLCPCSCLQMYARLCVCHRRRNSDDE